VHEVAEVIMRVLNGNPISTKAGVKTRFRGGENASKKTGSSRKNAGSDFAGRPTRVWCTSLDPEDYRTRETAET